jgi:hypothetical protein
LNLSSALLVSSLCFDTQLVPLYSEGAGGPSGSRKAADHRRLLKSYMKALFRHLNLAVDYKLSESMTYRGGAVQVS